MVETAAESTTRTTSRRRVLALAAGWVGAAALPRRTLAVEARRPTPQDAVAGAPVLGAPAVEAPSARFLAAVLAGDRPTAAAVLAADPGLRDVRDAAGRSAFAVALLAGHGELAGWLREQGHAPDLHESALALDWPRFEQLATAAPAVVGLDHPVGGTALWAAARGGAADQVWRAYGLGADANGNPRGAAGQTPLRAAFDHPDLVVAERTAAGLLANGADPNAPQRDGSSPLHAAAARGSAELCRMLLRKGADVAAHDAAGRSPRELAESAAALAGAPERIPVGGDLAGASGGRRGHSGGSGDFAEVLAILAAPDQILRYHSTSRTAWDVHGARFAPADLSAFDVVVRQRVVGMSHGNFAGVQELVGRHPELARAVASSGEHAVEASAHTGQREIVDYLLDRGAPYSLLTAVMRDDRRRVRELLDEDPQRIHERGPHDFALLWYPVIGGGLLELAELLLDRGAEVERQHHLGTTALHWAARRGQLEMAALLLARGADPERLSRQSEPAGETPLAIALGRGHAPVADLLRSRGARR